MSLAEFLSSPAAPKRKLEADEETPKASKAPKNKGPDLYTPWNSGESTFAIKQHPKGYAQVEHLVGGSPYPFTSAAVISSANTLRPGREFDTQMKVHFRIGDHPKINEARAKEMRDFIAWIHKTADDMLSFVWDNRDTLVSSWRDKSLKKSIERAFKNDSNPDKAKKKWLESEKLFRSYEQNWESTGPSICASRSFDAYGLSGKLDGQNDIFIWFREKQGGKGVWTKLGGKEKGPDAEDSPGLWQGATYIPKVSQVCLSICLRHLLTSFSREVSLCSAFVFNSSQVRWGTEFLSRWEGTSPYWLNRCRRVFRRIRTFRCTYTIRNSKSVSYIHHLCKTNALSSFPLGSGGTHFGNFHLSSRKVCGLCWAEKNSASSRAYIFELSSLRKCTPKGTVGRHTLLPLRRGGKNFRDQSLRRRFVRHRRLHRRQFGRENHHLLPRLSVKLSLLGFASAHSFPPHVLGR